MSATKESRVRPFLLLDICQVLSDAITARRHDDLTIAKVRSLAKRHRLIATLQRRAGSTFARLRDDEYNGLEQEWEHLADSEIEGLKLRPDDRGLGLVLIWVIHRLHTDLQAALKA